MKIWVTSDHHFGHKNIIKLCGRPFETVEEMNKVMVQKWNEVVAPRDIVYYLGDFALSNKKTIAWIANSLNGRKILVRGNHDKHGLFFYLEHFEAVLDSVEYQNILLTHVPRYDHTYRINLHGHIHMRSVKEMFPYVEAEFHNVGVDVNDFYPLDLHKIIERL